MTLEQLQGEYMMNGFSF